MLCTFNNCVIITQLAETCSKTAGFVHVYVHNQMQVSFVDQKNEDDEEEDAEKEEEEERGR